MNNFILYIIYYFLPSSWFYFSVLIQYTATVISNAAAVAYSDGGDVDGGGGRIIHG